MLLEISDLDTISQLCVWVGGGGGNAPLLSYRIVQGGVNEGPEQHIELTFRTGHKRKKLGEGHSQKKVENIGLVEVK